MARTAVMSGMQLAAVSAGLYSVWSHPSYYTTSMALLKLCIRMIPKQYHHASYASCLGYSAVTLTCFL